MFSLSKGVYTQLFEGQWIVQLWGCMRWGTAQNVPPNQVQTHINKSNAFGKNVFQSRPQVVLRTAEDHWARLKCSPAHRLSDFGQGMTALCLSFLSVVLGDTGSITHRVVVRVQGTTSYRAFESVACRWRTHNRWWPSSLSTTHQHPKSNTAFWECWIFPQT